MHSWKVSFREAAEIQNRLRKRISLTRSFHQLKTIAACDVAGTARGKKEGIVVAGVIVFRFPDLLEVERQYACVRSSTPYVPGFLTFREAPALLKALRKLKHPPDLFIFDGQGIAHPRGIGIAAHMGVWLNRPAIGCGKSRLCGIYREPGPRRGDREWLLDESGHKLGVILRTVDGVKPVFISPGHKIDFESAADIILSVSKYRIPEPVRQADQYVGQRKREIYGNVQEGVTARRVSTS